MKKSKFSLIIIGILIIGTTAVVQARGNFELATNATNSFSLFRTNDTYCPNSGNQLTNEEIDQIVKIHNETRQEVGGAPLKWNCDLAKFSQMWANADTFEHSSQQQREQIIKGGVAGENLAIDSSPTALMSALLKGWIDEKQFWNNDSNACVPDKVCGHYTQMVWKTTNEVGCGIIRNSKKLGSEHNSSYLVCTYFPGGNVGGEKPY